MSWGCSLSSFDQLPRIFFYFSFIEVSPPEVIVVDTGLLMFPAAQVGCLRINFMGAGFPDFGLLEVGALEVCSQEIGSPEIDFLEVGFLEVSFMEVGPPKVGPPEVGSVEIGSLEVAPLEVSSLKVRSDIRIFRPPLRPNFSALRKNLDVL